MTLTTSSPPRSQAERAAYFIERFCRQSKGEWAGKPLILRSWQRELIDGIFAEREDGFRKHRVAYIGLPRKNGKSTIGAAIALYGLIADNEPGAEVYSVAGDTKQAGIVFREARSMVLASPELQSKISVFQHHLEAPHNGGVYRVLSADAALQQGLNPSFVIFDEVHVQPDDALWVAMTEGMGTRRQPIIVGITTAGYDKTSLAWRLYDYGRRVASGEVEDPSFYFRWWEPPDREMDWREPETWASANPAFGDFLKPDSFTPQHTPESQFRRYRLNQWTTTQSAWLPFGTWEAIADRTRVVADGTEIVLSFDGAWTGDSAALLGTTIEERPHHFVIGSWERTAADADWEVPGDDVDRAVDAARERYRVREMPCDPHEWRREMQNWAARRIPVLKWETSSPTRMSPACGDFYKAVMDKRMTHDGDPRLARHIENAVLKEDRYGARIVKRSSSEHIDLAVTAVMGYDRALYYAGRKPARKRRLYSF